LEPAVMSVIIAGWLHEPAVMMSPTITAGW